MIILFWTMAVLVVYTYAGYPCIMFIYGLFNKKDSKRIAEGVFPQVTLLIAAYNEEKVIRKKIENSLGLDYPAGKLEIIVVSDGSTDATDAIVKEYSSRGVKLKAFRQRAGKTVALAGTVGEAAGEIIVFSDANGMYRKDAVKKLAGNFHDGTVGCVCGNLVYTGSDRGENVYWNFERMIKKYENRAGSILGAAGSIFAVRKELYVPLKVPVVDDFIEPLMILKKGYKVLFEPEAVSVEEMAASITGEYARKVRIITSSISGISNIGELFNPLKYGLFSLQLVSHKMLRWLAPFFLIALFTANLFLLSGVFYRVTMAVQVILCLLGLAGFFLDRKDVNIKIFSIPLYFMVVNLAALNAWYNFILGEKMIKWDTDRI